MSETILPYVRMLVPCARLNVVGEGDQRHAEVVDPLTVVDAQQGRVQLAVFACLSTGLGTFNVHVEVRYSSDASFYLSRGQSHPLPVTFSTQDRGVSTRNLAFQFSKGIPLPKPGLYEFRLMCGAEELPGAKAELRVLGK